MIKRPARWLAFAGIALFGHLGAKASGVCYTQGRVLADQELIDSAIAWRYDEVEALEYRRAWMPASACCTLTRSDNPYENPIEKALRLATGTTASTVTLNFRPVDRSATNPDFAGDPDIILVSNCGVASSPD